ncbi:MAG: hypothetical protein ABW146_06100 [Candidatus Sedimenticola sp. 6PFRAG7]
MPKKTILITGWLIMLAFFYPSVSYSMYWSAGVGKHPSMTAAILAKCPPEIGDYLRKYEILESVPSYAPGAVRFECFIKKRSDEEYWHHLYGYVIPKCDDGSSVDKETLTCLNEVKDCPSNQTQRTWWNASDGQTEYPIPHSVSIEGCLYVADWLEMKPKCFFREDGPGSRCWGTFKSTGDESTQDDTPTMQEPPPDETTPTSNETPATRQVVDDAPVVEADKPQPGATTTTEKTTETATKEPYKKIVNTDSKTEIIDVSKENIVKTKTTETTTYSDGTEVVTEKIEYKQDPVTVKKTEIEWSSGKKSSTSNTYPGKSGSKTETTTKNSDGSSSKTTTTTGGGADGEGTGTGTGKGPGDGDGEGEGEEEKFTGPEFGEAKTYTESLNDFYTRAKNSPLGQAANGIGNGMPSGGNCQPLSFDLYFGNVSTSIHCTTWDAVKGGLSIVMMAAWSLLAVYIFLSA